MFGIGLFADLWYLGLIVIRLISGWVLRFGFLFACMCCLGGLLV